MGDYLKGGKIIEMKNRYLNKLDWALGFVFFLRASIGISLASHCKNLLVYDEVVICALNQFLDENLLRMIFAVK